MKKLMTIFLAAALVFAVAGQASATALETSGEIRARGWFLDNYLQDKHSTEFWDQRLRVNGVWNVAEGVKVQFRADILEGFWGDNTQAVSHTTQVDPLTGSVTVAESLIGTAPKDQITFDQVNMQFAWPGTPLTITAGRQDVTWGLGVAAKADNRDRLKVAAKVGGLTVVYAYDKFAELFSLHDVKDANGRVADDSRGNALGVVGDLAGFKTGLLAYYSQNETNASKSINRLLLDAYFNGKVGAIDLKGEVAYVTGKDDNAVGNDPDATGLGAYLGAFLPAGPVTVGLEGAYAKGDDPDTTDNEGAFRHDYHSPFWSVILLNNMDYPGFANESALAGDGGLNNAMAGKLSVSAAPMKGLSLYAAAVYATRDQVAAGKDKPMGTEIDLIATYAVTENVALTVGGGYLMVGDFYGDVDNPLGAVVAFSTKF